MTAGLKVRKSIFNDFISAIEVILCKLRLAIGMVLYPVPWKLAGKAKVASLNAIELMLVWISTFNIIGKLILPINFL